MSIQMVFFSISPLLKTKISLLYYFLVSTPSQNVARLTGNMFDSNGLNFILLVIPKKGFTVFFFKVKILLV